MGGNVRRDRGLRHGRRGRGGRAVRSGFLEKTKGAERRGAAMKIGADQVASLQAIRNGRFATRLAGIVRACHADETAGLTDRDLHERLVATIARAQSYGLRADDDLIKFARLTFVVGSRFDEYPFFEDILGDETIDPEVRLLRIFELAEPDDWRAAQELSRA